MAAALAPTPKDLRSIPKTREIRVSLRTGLFSEAEKLSSAGLILFYPLMIFRRNIKKTAPSKQTTAPR